MLGREVEAALQVAEEAGRLLRRRFRSPVDRETKADGEPVSSADLEADRLIVGRLREAFRQDAVLSEESPDDLERLQASRVWIVDPLDGTREFLAGLEDFAVHLGLAVDGEAVLGLVHQPIGERTWLGVRGGGARKRTGSSAWHPLRVGPTGRPLRVAVTRAHRSSALSLLLHHLPPHQTIRRGGSGLKAVLVAEGGCDLYLAATNRMREWDVCAPHAVVEAAGGTCTDLLGRPLRYNRKDPRLRAGFLASSAAQHRKLVEALAPGCAQLPWLP